MTFETAIVSVRLRDHEGDGVWVFSGVLRYECLQSTMILHTVYANTVSPTAARLPLGYVPVPRNSRSHPDPRNVLREQTT